MTGPKNIAILGSTGSIGCSALDVVRSVDGLNVVGLSGHSQIDLLAAQADEFQPDWVVGTDPVNSGSFPDCSQACWGFHVGDESLAKLVTDDNIDIVLAAIVGIAGLPSAWAAIDAGKTLALANKETMVVAGQHLARRATETGSQILPVDSEHSAIFQAMQAGNANEVSRIILTASGGPFRDFTTEQMKTVTVEQALNHPTWNMGKKNSIDSATMMNKALEIIEARWLFDIPASQLEVVVHPQSIIHSIVEFTDGSSIAQLSPPDMKLPIQYAFTWPDRVPGPSPKLDLSSAMTMELLPPDFERFPALKLGFEVAEAGGTAGAVLNAANESAVEAFLNNEISFGDIATACRQIVEQHNFDPNPTLDDLFAADHWARQEMSRWMFA